MSTTKERRMGLVCAIIAQLGWGFFPLYLYLLREIDSVDLVAHRILWSFSTLLIGLYVGRLIALPFLPEFEDVKKTLKDGEQCGTIAFGAIMILINWLVFVWAVNHDHAVDASLGYYICPHIVVLLGIVFFGERLSIIQWFAVAFAIVGVFFMTRSATSVPTLGLTIAFSFGLYAMVKKKIEANALTSLLFETAFLLPLALVYLIVRWDQTDQWNPLLSDWWLNILVVVAGFMTIFPLAFYSKGVKHIQLSTMGLLQYLAPTIQFAIGVFIFHESFDHNRILGFVFVWIGVILFMLAIGKKASTIQVADNIATDAERQANVAE